MLLSKFLYLLYTIVRTNAIQIIKIKLAYFCTSWIDDLFPFILFSVFINIKLILAPWTAKDGARSGRNKRLHTLLAEPERVVFIRQHKR